MFGSPSALWKTKPDNCNYNSSGVVLHVGGNYNQNLNHGLFYLNGNNSASNTNANIGGQVLILIYNVFLRVISSSPLGENQISKIDGLVIIYMKNH